jgi:methylmalonyl-CoA/ethylmalonyl-CoA epimerase
VHWEGDVVAVDHVGLAVRDLRASLDSYAATLGLRNASVERDDARGIEEAVLSVGDGCVQLLTPTSPASTIARFLDRRGPGIHHFAFRVGDLERALAAAERGGARVLEPRVQAGSRGTRIAFLDPRGFGGALVELVEHG